MFNKVLKRISGTVFFGGIGVICILSGIEHLKYANNMMKTGSPKKGGSVSFKEEA